VATGGGGYQWASVVPRAWTTYFAAMAGVDLPDELPAAWVERARAQAGHDVPRRLSEPALVASAEEVEGVRRSIDEVRRRIFPFHGLS